MSENIVGITGDFDGELIAGHKLIEAQLDYVFEEGGKLYRTSVPLTRGGTVLVLVLPEGAQIVGMGPGEVVTIDNAPGHKWKLTDEPIEKVPEIERQPIAQRVIDFLSDRKGFDHWWDNIDDDIQEEIIRELDEMVPA